MSDDAVKQERRRARRVDATLALNLHLDLPQGGGDVETINVSSTGVYFRTSAYIEPMTKLAMSFDVELDEGETRSVECEGIVARVQPDLPSEDVDTYEVAVFFTTIDAESLHNLERYVELRLAP
jgi:hypothetical protein